MSVVRPDLAARYTVADLEHFPDDGNRYELFDGELVVTPMGSEQHQWVGLQLFVLLRAAAPPGVMVFGPVNLDRGERTHLEPDVTVKRRADFGSSRFVPLLVAEVASPCTRVRDRTRKRAYYEAMGCPSYWLLDPLDPTLTVLELGPDGRYAEVATVRGEQGYDAARPFPVRVVPAHLADPDG